MVSTYSESMFRHSRSKEPTPRRRDAPCAAALLHRTFSPRLRQTAPTAPAASAATGNDGTFKLGGLGAGNYKLRFRGAGFVELWYGGNTP